MSDQPLVVHLVPGQERREWCDRCLTSAVLTVPVYALHGTVCQQVGTYSECTRCDRNEGRP